MSESDLIKRVQDGSMTAYEELMSLHIREIRSHVALRIPLPMRIDEIAHDTFVAGFQNVAELSPEDDTVEWLKTIADGFIEEEIRRCHEPAVKAALDPASRLIVTQLSDQKTVVEWVHLEECLSHLEGKNRLLIHMKYGSEQSTEELAKGLERSETWVRTSLFRLRRILKDCIEQHWYAEGRK